jgi:hypothetical protein
MLTRLLVLLSINILISKAYIAQQEFCKSAVVVKAKILPKDTLYGQIPKPAVPKFNRLFEIKILEVFKDDLSSGWDKNSLHYAISRDTTWNPDADGCDISASWKAIEVLLYFDSLDTVKRTCRYWGLVSPYEKKALRKDLYDCQCDIDQCYDSASGKTGKPDCDRKRLNMIRCARDHNNQCVWRGSKKTCVSCNKDIATKKQCAKNWLW